MQQGRRIQRTSWLAIGLLSFVAGVGFAKVGWNISAWYVVILGGFTLLSFRRVRLVSLVTVCVFGFVLGWWRGMLAQHQLRPYLLSYDQKVSFVATANTDAIYADSTQLSFDAGSIEFLSPLHARVPGVVTIKGIGANAIYRGDRLVISGKLKPTLGGKQGRMSYAQLQVVGHHDSFIDGARRRFNAGLISALPEPLASFGLGLLIGQRNTLPDAITKELSAIGLSHIVAVSGYNLTIIVDAVRRILGKRSKYQGTLISLLLITAFLVITGLSASIVRAAVVSVLGLWAWYYGRAFKPVLLLALSAAITLAWYPFYIWGDIGWYLSFAAFFGVLVLCPLVVKRVYKPPRKPKELASIVIECLCAQAVTAPIILYIFQQTSTVAVASNVLVVPLVPLAMLLTFVAGLAGSAASAFAGWLAWPARLLLTYMLDVVQLFARIPHASVSRSISLVYTLLMYALVIMLCVVLRQKTREKYAIISAIETASRAERPG